MKITCPPEEDHPQLIVSLQYPWRSTVHRVKATCLEIRAIKAFQRRVEEFLLCS